MRYVPRAGAILVTIAAAVATLSAATPQSRTEYRTRDGSVAVVVTVKKWNPEATQENVVEFYSLENQRLCTLDYSSEDGEHAFGVVKAAWTPDGRYFVFSLTSSGGHQSWSFPTNFYSPRDGEIHSLNAYIAAAGISKGDFTLKPPSTVLTEIWRAESQESVPAGFRLDSLMERKHRSQHALQCAGGKIIHKEG